MYSKMDGKPLQGDQNRRDVVPLLSTSQKASGSVLHYLQATEGALIKTYV